MDPTNTHQELSRRCTTCDIPIDHSSKSLLLSHYRSSFHTFNLLRKSSDLSPISLMEYRTIGKGDMGNIWRCEYCQKILKNEKRLQQHMKDCTGKKQAYDKTELLNKEMGQIFLGCSESRNTTGSPSVNLTESDTPPETTNITEGLEKPGNIINSSTGFFRPNNETKDIEMDNSFVLETAIYDPSDLPFLHLPNGTVLGNKKYLIYFKQRHNREFKPRNSQLVHVSGENHKWLDKAKLRNDFKVAVNRNTPLRFRLQWSQ